MNLALFNNLSKWEIIVIGGMWLFAFIAIIVAIGYAFIAKQSIKEEYKSTDYQPWAEMKEPRT